MTKKWQYFFLGLGTSALGLGLQNYNPFEPRACTHSCSIALGIFFYLMPMLINVGMFVYEGLRDKLKGVD